jgi:hypothetical protein
MFPDIHECINLPRKGVRIQYSREYSELSCDSWRMIVYRETGEEDLEKNSYLETIGDPVWVTALDIIHCPFCGRNLYEGMQRQHIPAGNGVHVDYSDWSAKIG